MLPLMIPSLMIAFTAPDTWAFPFAAIADNTHQDVVASLPLWPGQALPSLSAPTVVSAAATLAHLPTSAGLANWGKKLTSVAEQKRLATAGQLISYLGLQQDWDGEGADPPSPSAIYEAIQMLQAVPPDLPVPKAMVLPEGQVAIYWDLGDRFAEIGFKGTGKFYAYAEHPTLNSVQMDDVAISQDETGPAFPEAVRNLLNFIELANAV